MAIRSALVTTDPAFRAVVAELMQRPERGRSLLLELNMPFTQIGDDQISALREADPELVLVDIEQDPVLGLRFAQFLSEQSPLRRLIAVGPPLGPEMLLNAMRAGVVEYLPKPVSREALDQAVEVQLRRIRWAPNAAQGEPGQLLAIFSPKGGAGSTTVATNLAIHLHRLTGKRTLLVDLDLELGEIALQLGVESRFNFIDMVRNFHRMDAELMTSYIEHHPTGVHVLSAPYHPERAELVTGEQIAQILRFLKQHYDYLVVDTSKSFSAPILAALEQADQIYLVTVADLPSLRNIARCLPLLRQVAHGDERLRLVLNRHQPDGLIQLAEIEQAVGLKVYRTIANDYDAIVHSMNLGSPIVLNGPSPYAADLKAMGAVIAGLASAEAPTRTRLARVVDPVARLLRRGKPVEVEATA